MMEEKYFIEGHRPKTEYADFETLIIEPKETFPSVGKAVEEARNLFGSEENLGLAVIFKEGRSGDRELVKFLFRTDEGGVDEFPFW
jgi:hypothetical protein